VSGEALEDAVRTDGGGKYDIGTQSWLGVAASPTLTERVLQCSAINGRAAMWVRT
jgi:hypothetical protein